MGYFKPVINLVLLKELLRSSKYILIVGICGVLISNIDTIVVGRWFGFENAGIYSVMIKLGTLLSFPLIAFNSYLAPQISKYHYLNKPDDLNKLLYKSSAVSSILGVVGFIALVYCISL